MLMMIVLGWKISKSKVVVEEGGVCNQGEGVMDVNLEEGVAEVDMGLPVKCVEWVLRRGMRGILVESHTISSY